MAQKWPSEIYLEIRKSRNSPWDMAARAGIEPASGFLQAALLALTSESVKSAGAQHGAQKLRELTEVVAAWWSLAPEIRAAIVTMARTARKDAP